MNDGSIGLNDVDDGRCPLRLYFSISLGARAFRHRNKYVPTNARTCTRRYAQVLLLLLLLLLLCTLHYVVWWHLIGRVNCILFSFFNPRHSSVHRVRLPQPKNIIKINRSRPLRLLCDPRGPQKIIGPVSLVRAYRRSNTISNEGTGTLIVWIVS